jgi:drug/metabolite transporter (DMT)-like permease
VDPLTVTLALLAAMGNGAATVLQRRAAVEQGYEERAGGAHPAYAGSRRRQAVRRVVGLLRRRYWLVGFGALILAAAFQAGALTVGELSVVQPLLASELLFTLLVGSIVFRHRPDPVTWLSFLMLAVGLALFMAAVAPSGGTATAHVYRWLPVGSALALAVALLALAAHAVHGAPRATVLGALTAVGFATTAALIKEVTGQITQGAAAVFTSGYLYATGVVGLLSFAVLQSTLRAGTLAASQPSLTLGDALVSVVLGWALYGERIALGDHALAGALGAFLIAAGTTGLARSPAVAGHATVWDTVSGRASAPRRGVPRWPWRRGRGAGRARRRHGGTRRRRRPRSRGNRGKCRTAAHHAPPARRAAARPARGPFGNRRTACRGRPVCGTTRTPAHC